LTRRRFLFLSQCLAQFAHNSVQFLGHLRKFLHGLGSLLHAAGGVPHNFVDFLNSVGKTIEKKI